MVTSFEVLESAETVVFTTLLETLAAAACDQIEKAGLPAVVCQAAEGFAVVVPSQYSAEAFSLLNASPHYGEIYLYRA